MSIPLETLEVAVLRLSPTDRARLLDRVVASLDADGARDAAWDAVAGQREAALASGAATEAPLDDVLARLKAELA
jgi:Putative addiction module component